MEWSEFDVFGETIDSYMPRWGEGETMASQICTAVNKLIYKWYNDGDVFDNTHYLSGWCNNLSSYANWLYNNTTDSVKQILDRICIISSDTDYERLLWDLAVELLNSDILSAYEKLPLKGSIYNECGKFRFIDGYEDEEDEDEEDD